MPVILTLVLLGCGSKVQEANFAGLLGDACDDERPCRSGLACDHLGVCAEEGTPGTFAEGEDCLLTPECGWGLVCDATSHCARPGAPGTGAEGEGCASDADCQMGYACGEDGACEDLGIPYWEGVSCAPDEGPFRVHFEVPDLPAAPGIEFYRLPFPNDARLVNGQPDLSGHPSPGSLSPAVDLWIEAVEALDGWPQNPVVILRTSGRLDPTSVRAFSDADTLFFASVDPGAEDYGYRSSFVYEATTGRSRYACNNQVRVTTWPGEPLAPDTPYAVWLTRDLRDASGATPARAEDLNVVLGDERPGGDGDFRLVPAWDAFAPFRDFLDAQGIDRDTVAGATVFTTGNSARRAWNIGYAVETAALDPSPSDLTLCDGEAASPCDDGGARACGQPVAGMHELHGRLAMPDLQDGDPPYDDGTGGWVWSSANTPFVRGTTAACFALTVPEGAPPAGGWPVVLASHARGGSFRDPIAAGMAAALAEEGVALLSVELPLHGERGDAARFFDLQNPAASLGNRLQVAAELHQTLLVVEALALDAGGSPTGEALALDADAVVFLGHGAGGESALAALANTRGVQAAVLAGVGGVQGLVLSERREPGADSGDLRRLLADTSHGPTHPMVALMQASLERGDAVVYGEGLLRDPPSGSAPKHLLQLYGLDDAVSPESAQQALQAAMGLPTVGAVSVDWGQPTRDAPTSENLLSEAGGRYTGGSVQLDGGHDALATPEGQAAALRFLVAAARGEAPVVE